MSLYTVDTANKILEPLGITPLKEQNLRERDDLQEWLVSHPEALGEELLIIQKEFDVRNAEMIAKELGLKVVSINPLSYHWDKEMINIAEALAR